MKRVVVIASGETERRSLPHLLAGLEEEGVTLADVRVPPGGRRLDADMVARLIIAAWWEMTGRGQPPDKFVVLTDTDGKESGDVIGPLKANVPPRLGSMPAPVLFAYAQWHLEAWFFGDSAGLRAFLGGSLGHADTSSPDGIENPKGHLGHLLGTRTYTARVSEEIAKTMNASTIAGRSPSFAGFILAVRNGPPPSATPPAS